MKVLGLGYRIQHRNGKLRKVDRKNLLNLAESKYNLDLDGSLRDREIVQRWNDWFETEGSSHPDFLDQALKEYDKQVRRHKRPSRKMTRLKRLKQFP